jgi:tRNA(Leu) C34 or U34 (ribose-2'-O)-methylase TrmL
MNPGGQPLPPSDAGGFAAIGLHNPQHPDNVGGVLRAARCFGVALVAIAGTRYRVHRADTAHAYRFMPLLQVDDLHAVVPYDCVPVAVERHPDAVPLPLYDHPERAFYVFGPEDGDLNRQVLGWCRDIVAVPTAHSLNLAAAVNVLLYDRLAKQLRGR